MEPGTLGRIALLGALGVSLVAFFARHVVQHAFDAGRHSFYAPLFVETVEFIGATFVIFVVLFVAAAGSRVVGGP